MRSCAGLVAACSAGLLAQPARAGEQVYLGIAAVTPEGAYAAVFQVDDNSYDTGRCGLIQGAQPSDPSLR